MQYVSHISAFFLFLVVERSISDDSLRRYVQYASESCIQELLMSASVSVSPASETDKLGNRSDGWRVLNLENGVEVSKRRSGSLHMFRSRWVLRSVSPQQFITVANAIDAAKVILYLLHAKRYCPTFYFFFNLV